MFEFYVKSLHIGFKKNINMQLVLAMLISVMQSVSNHRYLDVYTDNQENKIYTLQIQLLTSDPEGLKERDLIIRLHSNSHGFRIELTGKDGSKKFSSTKILNLPKLYAIIDAMPMRKQQILEKNNEQKNK